MNAHKFFSETIPETLVWNRGIAGNRDHRRVDNSGLGLQGSTDVYMIVATKSSLLEKEITPILREPMFYPKMSAWCFFGHDRQIARSSVSATPHAKMAPKVFKIAPEPDVVIVLVDPLVNARSLKEPIVGFPGRTISQSTCDNESVTTTSVGYLTPKTEATVTEGTLAQTESYVIPEGSVYYHVFLGCLKAAISFFRKLQNFDMLHVFPDGQIYITATNMDETALLNILYIIHFRNNLVPREVSLEQLARTAVLVDHFHYHEAVQIVSDIWCQHVKSVTNLPHAAARTQILQIYVALVFCQEDWFNQATQRAKLYSKRFNPGHIRFAHRGSHWMPQLLTESGHNYFLGQSVDDAMKEVEGFAQPVVWSGSKFANHNCGFTTVKKDYKVYVEGALLEDYQNGIA
ncbi:hypothetical protein BU23DRAFT_566234 [Bimuria novae-zelandiae CBS 107.79]|uniref:BTB domain-containing protein n=1 Tax=Bimuria novae-zelandiae CBS 107.79 TaxID=1447943 RepID=A0A6A5VH72_9PLEO|nr:hypothetical protein BU23DRAFT_566234 [Bimuria novae-zelandiae CBS 107.79]